MNEYVVGILFGKQIMEWQTEENSASKVSRGLGMLIVLGLEFEKISSGELIDPANILYLDWKVKRLRYLLGETVKELTNELEPEKCYGLLKSLHDITRDFDNIEGYVLLQAIYCHFMLYFHNLPKDTQEAVPEEFFCELRQIHLELNQRFWKGHTFSGIEILEELQKEFYRNYGYYERTLSRTSTWGRLFPPKDN